MRARPGFVALLAIALVGVAGGGYAARALLSPTTSRTSDTFLAIASASNMGPQPAFTGVATFQPETGSVEPLLDTPWQPVVSPEGRDLYFRQSAVVGHELRTSIVSIDADSRRQRRRLVTVAVLDARTSAPLPDGVELSDGVPSQLEVAGFGNGVTTRFFDQIGHGVYSGTLNLWSAGPWQLWAAVPDGQGHTGRYLIGTLRVAAP